MSAEPDLAEATGDHMSDPRFVMLDLPPPVSVNKYRKIDWSKHATLEAWKRHADLFVLAAKRRPDPPKFEKLERFSVTLILSEDHCKLDLDNAVKSVVDYLKRIEVIADDAPKNMRVLHVMWGNAPAGCRVIVRGCE